MPKTFRRRASDLEPEGHKFWKVPELSDIIKMVGIGLAIITFLWQSFSWYKTVSDSINSNLIFQQRVTAYMATNEESKGQIAQALAQLTNVVNKLTEKKFKKDDRQN